MTDACEWSASADPCCSFRTEKTRSAEEEDRWQSSTFLKAEDQYGSSFSWFRHHWTFSGLVSAWQPLVVARYVDNSAWRPSIVRSPKKGKARRAMIRAASGQREFTSHLSKYVAYFNASAAALTFMLNCWKTELLAGHNLWLLALAPAFPLPTSLQQHEYLSSVEQHRRFYPPEVLWARWKWKAHHFRDCSSFAQNTGTQMYKFLHYHALTWCLASPARYSTAHADETLSSVLDLLKANRPDLVDRHDISDPISDHWRKSSTMRTKPQDRAQTSFQFLNFFAAD